MFGSPLSHLWEGGAKRWAAIRRVFLELIGMKNRDDLFDVGNDIAVITGAAGQLGSQYCRAFLERGAHDVFDFLQSFHFRFHIFLYVSRNFIASNSFGCKRQSQLYRELFNRSDKQHILC